MSLRPSTYVHKPLNHSMTQRTRRRRVEEKRAIFAQWAEQEKVSVVALLGYLLHVETYHEGDRGIAAVGWQIFTGQEVFGKPDVTEQEATWMIEKGHLSQSVWLEFRLLLLNRIVLPPVYKVYAYNSKHRPALTIYRHGVRAMLSEVLSSTLSERLVHMDLSNLDSSSLSVFFKFGWGLDGSGDHSNFNQLTKRHFSTKSVMSVCVSVRTVVAKDSNGKEVRWTSSAAGSNKPQNVRPLALFPSKENRELMEEFVPLVEQEIEEIKDKGVVGKAEDKKLEVTCTCEEAKLSMADGKMVTTLLRLEGAYCTMCFATQEESQKSEVIQEGFKITRSVQQITDLALALTDPETGKVSKKRDDYKTRQGICGLPITTSDLTNNIPVCHAKIRSFEFIIDLLVRYLSHRKWYTPKNKVTYTKADLQLYKEKREWLKEFIYNALAINIGNPGDSYSNASYLMQIIQGTWLLGGAFSNSPVTRPDTF